MTHAADLSATGALWDTAEAKVSSLTDALTSVQAQLVVALGAPATATPSGKSMPQVESDPRFRRVLGIDRWGTVDVATALRPYPVGWVDTSNAGHYSGSTLTSVTDELLVVRLATLGGVPWVTALVPTATLAPQTYGKYEVRFRAHGDGGYKTAWLLWPDDNVWPAHGEIDFPEGPIGGNFSAFAHYALASGGQAAISLNISDTDWHTCTVEWTPGLEVFKVDGAEVGRSTKAVPFTPMHWVLQSECNTTPRSGVKPPAASVATIEIEYVTVATYVA